MNAISRIASLLALAAIARAESDDESHESHDSHEESMDEHVDELTISILATWDSFAAGLDVSPESVEYDGDNDLWYMGNWFEAFTENSKAGQICSLSGDYPVTDMDNFDLQEDIMNMQAILPSGMVYSDDALFVADIAGGVVHKFDTINNTYAGVVATGSIANGLCMDSVNNMLYATSTGINFLDGTNDVVPEWSGLWSIDPDTLEATRLYDGSNSGFPDDFVFAPNGCYVNDDKVYMVDVGNSTGSLGIYDIATGELTRNAEVLAAHPRCDGIVYYGGFWFVTDVGQGQLLALNTAVEGAIFEVVLDGLTGAADICLGPDNTIAIPSVGNGTIWFAQFEISHDHDDSSEENSGAASVCVFSAFAIIAAALF